MAKQRWILSDNALITKRVLGVLLLVAGVIILCAALIAEVINTQTSEFGTVQKLATVLGAVSLLIGITLLPLGNRPA